MKGDAIITLVMALTGDWVIPIRAISLTPIIGEDIIGHTDGSSVFKRHFWRQTNGINV